MLSDYYEIRVHNLPWRDNRQESKMSKVLKLVSFLACSSALLLQPVLAQTAAAPAKPAKQHVKSKAAAPAPEKVEPVDPNDEDTMPADINASVVTEYDCDHATKITFFKNPGDEDHVAIRWNKMLMRMKRVVTTTGADRFENRHYGLIWIGIPTKSILLDSKKGQQLANECKNPQQMAPQS
jgi:hypothetical protein